MAYRYHEYFEPSRPREAKGGIKAQSGRGGFGRSWWARRWIEILEGFDLGARLGRGRSYARRGQVLSIDVEKGAVTARVQGSRARPYRVEIKVSTLGRSDWKKLTTALSGGLSSRQSCWQGRCPIISKTSSGTQDFRSSLTRALTLRPTARAPTGRILASTSRRSTSSWARSSIATRSLFSS